MSDFWKGRKVFLTSPASFRGAWICAELLKLEAQVFGYGELPKTSPHFFDLENISQKIGMTVGSLTDQDSLTAAMHTCECEIVLHLGAELSVKEVRVYPLQALESEVMGTGYVFEALRQTATARVALVLSSDKVYQRTSEEITESSPIAAGEVAPTTKLCAELVALSYREQFFSPKKFNKHKVAVGVARVGSAIASGDLSEDSLVFQAMSSFVAQNVFHINKPSSVRTWIDMQDQVQGLLLIAEHLYQQGPKALPIWNVAGNEEASVGQLVALLAQAWSKATGSEETWQDFLAPETLNTKASSFHPVLSSQQMLQVLGWAPKIKLSATAQNIVNWYQNFYLRA